MTTNLKTLVLKTVTVTGVKPVTPADRIGLGFGVAAYPTDNLSPGRNPAPRNPEPEQARGRQLSAMQMREQMRSDRDAVPPVGSTGTGCPGAPGVSAGRSATSSSSSLTTSWRRTERTTAVGGARVVRLHAVHDRTDLPGDLANDLTGRDCQSPRRFSGKQVVATRKIGSAATARK